MRSFGTERIEDEIRIFFPEARVARMDYDSTHSRKSYERIINDFENRKIDILVGTQMVSKGLHFDNVNVVGIINADNMLNFPDFRAFERSYQLMAQVSGRAGRKHKRGKVIIQSSDPENPVILDVVDNDYVRFYNQQLKERKEYKYPPFYRIIIITLKSKNLQILNDAAMQFAINLQKQLGKKIYGPHLPLVSKIQNFHLKNILIKIEKGLSVSHIKDIIRKESGKVLADEKFKSVLLLYDVDPL
jgi:primosomal protein N' (replication factor Y)